MTFTPSKSMGRKIDLTNRVFGKVADRSEPIDKIIAYEELN